MTHTPELVGNWTPAIADDSHSDAESQAYFTQTGHYVKRGSLVWIYCRLHCNGFGTLTTTQQANIVGLPFDPALTSLLSGGEGVSMNLPLTSQSVFGKIEPSGAGWIDLYRWGSTSGTSILTLDQFTSNAEIALAGVYRTND